MVRLYIIQIFCSISSTLFWLKDLEIPSSFHSFFREIFYYLFCLLIFMGIICEVKMNLSQSTVSCLRSSKIISAHSHFHVLMSRRSEMVFFTIFSFPEFIRVLISFHLLHLVLRDVEDRMLDLEAHISWIISLLERSGKYWICFSLFYDQSKKVVN